MTARIENAGIILFLCGALALGIIMAARAFNGDAIIAGAVFIVVALVTLAAIVATIRDI